MYIVQKKIRRSIPVRVKQGKNTGKKAGHIIYEDGNDAYYYVEKHYRKGQMWHKPQYMGYVNVSVDIIEKLIKRDIKKAVFMFIGYEKDSFYIIIPLKEFQQGRVTEYDDKQFQVNWKDKPRIYGNQIQLEGIR